jgi:hypothetical protein
LDLVRLWYSLDLIRKQKYNGTYCLLKYRRCLLLLAADCFTGIKNNNIFSPKKKKKEKRRRKKGYANPTAMQRRLSRFLRKKYYPKRSAGVEIFFSKPAGATFTAGKRNC